jgi:hypothetical protein
MPNPSPPTDRGYNHTPPSHVSKASIINTEPYQASYQQALDDFAILPLLYRLQTYSDATFNALWVALTPQEAKAIAILLIQALTATLNGNLLATYLKHLRCPALDLSQPRFLYGDRLRWISNHDTTDWGVAIGRFYSFAPHCCRWHWCYLIWLDPDSPSTTWVKADIAWEDDLEPFDAEAMP